VDEESAHREALARGLEADVLVTSGGVSVGPHDLVRAILASSESRRSSGASRSSREADLVRLSRQTDSSSACRETRCRCSSASSSSSGPLCWLSGNGDPGRGYERGVSARSWRGIPRGRARARAHQAAREGPIVEPLAGRESHMIARAAGADALVLDSTWKRRSEQGEPVEFLRI
jgi:molybdopterin biosynthesis enzyme